MTQKHNRSVEFEQEVDRFDFFDFMDDEPDKERVLFFFSKIRAYEFHSLRCPYQVQEALERSLSGLLSLAYGTLGATHQLRRTTSL